jgi:hypothetical protein
MASHLLGAVRLRPGRQKGGLLGKASGALVGLFAASDSLECPRIGLYHRQNFYEMDGECLGNQRVHLGLCKNFVSPYSVCYGGQK